MNQRARLAILIVGLGLLGFSRALSALPALRLENATCKTEFQAGSVPSAVKIRGELKEGTLCGGALVEMGNELTGSVQVPLQALDTGIELRTRHMKENYLEVAKYPVAELVLGSLPVAEGGGDFRREDVPFSGTMKLHGAEKKVSGKAALWRKGKLLGLSLELDLSMKDFGIETPSFFGVNVGDKVGVKASVSGPMEEIIL